MSIATAEQSVVDKVERKLFIGGEWREASGGGTLDVIDPATEEPICEVADGTPEDAMAALDAAVEKQAEWASSPPNDRAGILWKAFELMNERADELATLMTLEMGKPVAESKAEITYAADFFRWYSGEALRIDGNYKQFANGTSRVLVMKQPVGPALMITPCSIARPKVCSAGVADSASRPNASKVLAAPRDTASQLAPSLGCSSRKMP